MSCSIKRIVCWKDGHEFVVSEKKKSDKRHVNFEKMQRLKNNTTNQIKVKNVAQDLLFLRSQITIFATLISHSQIESMFEYADITSPNCLATNPLITKEEPQDLLIVKVCKHDKKKMIRGK